MNASKTSLRPRSSRLTTLGLIGLVVVFAALAGLAGQCGEAEKPKAWTATPKGFVQSPEGQFVYRALSPDGSVIGIRHRLNEQEGDLDFWTEVFELEMVQGKGYKLISKSDVQSRDDVDGRLMVFEYAQGDTPYHYELALYVTPKSLVSVEAATELANLERYKGGFEAARAELNATLGDPKDSKR